MSNKTPITTRAFHLLKRKGVKYFLFTIPIFVIVKYLDIQKNRIKKGSERFITKDILGFKMQLDTYDTGLSQDLICDGIREEHLVESIKSKLKNGFTVIDIGANIGYYVLLESKNVGDTGLVYALEPVPDNVMVLKNNVLLNDCKNVEIFELAVGDKENVLPIYSPKDRNLSTMRPEAVLSSKMNKTMVKTVTLDDFICNKKFPNVIRMDVEGFEYQIIKGMPNILASSKPLLIFMELHFEFLPKHETIEILNTLKTFGFETSNVIFEGWTKGFLPHRVWGRILCYLRNKRYGTVPQSGILHMSIDDILHNQSILEGNLGALEICFEKRT